jgi:hypothetical protein
MSVSGLSRIGAAARAVTAPTVVHAAPPSAGQTGVQIDGRRRSILAEPNAAGDYLLAAPDGSRRHARVGAPDPAVAAARRSLTLGRRVDMLA